MPLEILLEASRDLVALLLKSRSLRRAQEAIGKRMSAA